MGYLPHISWFVVVVLIAVVGLADKPKYLLYVVEKNDCPEGYEQILTFGECQDVVWNRWNTLMTLSISRGYLENDEYPNWNPNIPKVVTLDNETKKPKGCSIYKGSSYYKLY